MHASSAQGQIAPEPVTAAGVAHEVPRSSVLDLIVARVRLALEPDRVAERARVERQLAGPAGGARARLAGIFGLSAGALDLFDLACALAADPSLAEAFAAAQGASHRVCPTEALARQLFGHSSYEPLWRAGEP